MDNKTYYAHETIFTHELYQFVVSNAFRRYLSHNHYEVYAFIESFNNHPKIKNDLMIEGLIQEGYMSGIMSHYLRHIHGIDFINYYPPKHRAIVSKEKEKFNNRVVCMITMYMNVSKRELNIFKLKEPEKYEFVKNRFIMDKAVEDEE